MLANNLKLIEFDCGNTAAKWRLVSGREIITRGVLGYEASFSSVFDSLPLDAKSLDGCRVASVAPIRVQSELEKSWVACSSSPIMFASVERECQGVRCGYDDVMQMGVDRWSALVGASKVVDGACVVVDAGTALTIDILNAQFQHQGGYILPGLELMLAALQEKTAIPEERIPGIKMLVSIEPGKQTSSAIAGAVSLSVSSFVSQALLYSGEDAELVLTGGQAQTVADLVQAPSTIVQDLVLDGLEYLVPMVVSKREVNK